MEKTALIGHSGFVGSFLKKRMPFTDIYRREDIGQIAGRAFDLIVCAGMPAAKWRANQNPDEDTLNTDRLIAALNEVHAGAFVLISTIDVYPGEPSCDERTSPRPEHTYGKNRVRLEEFVRATFPDHHILRLPALFGEGLKKNALFDLVHDNQVDKINPGSAFQWYDLEWLPGDIQLCLEQGIHEANLFTEPIVMETIRASLFPAKALNPHAPLARYDHKTMLPALHGESMGAVGYRASAGEVMEAMGRYVSTMSEV